MKNLHNMLKLFYNKYFITLYVLFFLLFIMYYTTLKITSINLEEYKLDTMELINKKDDINLPYFERSKGNKVYLFKGIIECGFFYQKTVNIIPDDRCEYIKINDRIIPLKIISGSLSDWKNGFVINIGDYLLPGINYIEIKIVDTWGAYGLNIKHSINDRLFFILSILIFLNIIILFYFVLKDLRFDIITLSVLLTGILIRFIYLYVVNYNELTHDVDGHIEYIKYIAQNYMLPEPDKGWQFYQPPLYYIISSIPYKIVQILNINDNYKILQFFSLIYMCVNLIFIQKIIRLMVKNNLFYYLSLLLAVFWPSSLFHSVRIGNDSLYYMFYFISLYYLILWFKNKYFKHILFSSIFAGLAFLTKSNAIILISIIGILLLIEFIRDKNKLLFLKKHYIIALIFLVSFSLNLVDNIYFFYKGKINSLIVGNIGNLNNKLKLQNNIENYIYFDIKTFLTEPFASPWEDKSGRQFFWNYLLKTSLFGEFSRNNNILRNFAVVVSFIFLIMLIYSFVPIFYIKKNKIKLKSKNILNSELVRNFRLINCLYKKKGDDELNLNILNPLILNLILSILAMIYFRAKFPYSCSNDFRYIFPVYITFILLFINSLIKIKNEGYYIFEYLSYILIFSFVILSLPL